MTLDIELFMCRTDNFGVLLHDPVTGATASIDAPDAPCVIEALERRGWQLTDIFTTHHHGDHIAGNLALKGRYGLTITGPQSIAGVDRGVTGGQHFDFAGHRVEVIATPGHTLDHLCYYLPEDRLLFAADTLFALGCGRLFEGGPEEMWQSLSKLMALPDDTWIYFGHEYTMSNARFSLSVDPANGALIDRVKEIEALRAKGGFTAPTRMDIEKATNPFLRVADPSIRHHLRMENAPDWQVFAELRRHKDEFK